MSNSKEDYDRLVAGEWQQLITLTSAAAHQVVARIGREDISLMVDDFYQYMLSDKDAQIFLSSQQVKQRLHATLCQWIQQVISSADAVLPDLIAAQRRVGEVHARIGIPIDLVARGIRRLKERLYQRLQQDMLDSKLCYDAMRFCSLTLDIAIEVMTTAYSRSFASAAKHKENYRLYTLLDNASLERERQLASLLNWENRFIYAIATGLPLEDVEPLQRAEFGLWFQHKGKHLFEQVAEISQIDSVMAETDTFIIGFQANGTADMQQRNLLLRTVRNNIRIISTLVSGLFDELSRYENGKDPLTQLLNRRFVPTILRREIGLAIRSDAPFVVVMVDIDYFKRINDTYGHDIGDAALKSVAAILAENVRSSDYVFRFGGEEFMLLFVETTQSQALMLIERIRTLVCATPIRTGVSQPINLTISAGLCAFDGHPDYERLIKKADSALYYAKQNGRNRIEIHKDQPQ
ncbi:diguanylate cyclase [Biostraticola tofi]|uniref:Diguanylate cyclase DosC n=1 Tax=Biostraticola tofi TaxID=466109 RepID=A0A4R3Z3U7_9GAMM|nr:diguanylate cyclase [Biostraticola tofi]TCV99957.1 diguanylate cyclase [Biostraticola tofi]